MVSREPPVLTTRCRAQAFRPRLPPNASTGTRVAGSDGKRVERDLLWPAGIGGRPCVSFSMNRQYDGTKGVLPRISRRNDERIALDAADQNPTLDAAGALRRGRTRTLHAGDRGTAEARNCGLGHGSKYLLHARHGRGPAGLGLPHLGRRPGGARSGLADRLLPVSRAGPDDSLVDRRHRPKLPELADRLADRIDRGDLCRSDDRRTPDPRNLPRMSEKAARSRLEVHGSFPSGPLRLLALSTLWIRRVGVSEEAGPVLSSLPARRACPCKRDASRIGASAGSTPFLPLLVSRLWFTMEAHPAGRVVPGRRPRGRPLVLLVVLPRMAATRGQADPRARGST
jgi:hypothetical protein